VISQTGLELLFSGKSPKNLHPQKAVKFALKTTVARLD
jgi:hypothetical protein